MGKRYNKPNNNRNNKANGSSNRGGSSKGNFHAKKQGMQGDVMGTPYDNQDSFKSRNQRRAAEAANIDAVMSRSNPVGYYTKFDQFVTDAATLPFAQPVGAKNTVVDYVTDYQSGNSVSTYIVPGVCVLYFIPSIGISKDFSSPINRSSIRFYTYLRSNQKASALYDHQDVTMMEVALDSCYMFHGLCSKIYAIINQFTPVNEYYSRATVAACGGNFDDIRSNLQDFRAYINAFAYSLGQYALPKDITLFDRHRWMVEGQYTDSDSTKAQTYMFVPAGFWKYDNTVTTGSQCTWVPYQGTTYTGSTNPTLYTFEQLKQLGDSLLNAVSNEEDFAVISGDIYNFYGGDTYKLPYIGENYAVAPAYDKTVLSQIENSVIVPIDASSLTITQQANVNTGAILFQPKIDFDVSCSSTTEMNFHWDRPTPNDVIEASRLLTVIDASSATTGGIVACGTEIVCGMRIFTRNPATMAFRALNYATNVLNVQNADTVSTVANVIQRMVLLAQFDWAPQLRLWAVPSTGTPTLLGTTWDVDNFDSIPQGYLSNIHLGCLLSLFKVGTNRE